MSCTVCTEELSLPSKSPIFAEDPIQLSCGHIFHTDCFHQWFDRQRRNGCPTTCPNCRQILSCPLQDEAGNGCVSCDLFKEEEERLANEIPAPFRMSNGFWVVPVIMNDEVFQQMVQDMPWLNPRQHLS